jgi:hypothetical protein
MPAVEDLADAATQLAGDEDRDRAVRRLRDLAGDRRGLEALRDYFVDRLHRRADDFDATRGLRLVIAALQRVPTGNGHPPGLGASTQGAARRRRRQLWHRR